MTNNGVDEVSGSTRAEYAGISEQRDSDRGLPWKRIGRYGVGTTIALGLLGAGAAAVNEGQRVGAETYENAIGSATGYATGYMTEITSAAAQNPEIVEEAVRHFF